METAVTNRFGSVSRSQPRVPAACVLAACVLAACVVLAACERAPETATATGPGSEERGPIGDEAYSALLTEQVGLKVTGAELAVQARRQMNLLEQRMAEEAAGLGRSSWREALGEALAAGPDDPSAVLDAYRREIERSYEHLRGLGLVTLPADGPSAVEVTEIANPVFQRYFSLAMYLDGRLAVTARPADGDTVAADDYLRNHCDVCIPPLAVHEVFPGHHLAYRRAAEEEPDEAVRQVLNRRHTVYHEGWGLYAEQLMLEHGYYAPGTPTLGALRLIYLRALRALIDPELHGGRLSRDAAEELYVTRALMTPSAARSEVDRHLKDPGLKATYFIGARLIHGLRDRFLKVHPGASLREFHDGFLGLPAPLPDVARRLGLDLSSSDLSSSDLSSSDLSSSDLSSAPEQSSSDGVHRK